MNNFWSKICEVSIWGCLPCFVLIIFALVIIISWNAEKNGIVDNEESIANNRIQKIGNMYERENEMSFVFLCLVIALILIPIAAIFNGIFMNNIQDMISKIDVIGSMILGLTTMVITLSVAITLFDKSYYIVFSIRDVLQNYKFSERLIMDILSCLVVWATLISLLNQEINSTFDAIRLLIFEIFTVYNIIFSTYLLFLIVYIMFSEQKKELKILEQLYRRFWIDKVDNASLKRDVVWRKEDIEINVEYLIKKYINVCKNKKILHINYIEFITTIGYNKNKWYKKARKKFLVFYIIIGIISITIDLKLLKIDLLRHLFIAINIISVMITGVLLVLKKRSIYLSVLRMALDTKGYYIYTNNSKEKFIPRNKFFKNNIYDQYIISMNSLNAFFYIWLNDFDDKNYKYIGYTYEKVIENIKVLGDKNIIVYMPIFVIGFFMYEKNLKSYKLRNIYNKMVHSNREIHLFERTIFSQIVYLTKNNEKSIKILNRYLFWLKGKR